MTISHDIAQQKLQKVIDTGREKAARVIEEVMAARPQDAVIGTERVTFSDTLSAVIGQTELRLHDNAFSQALGRTGIPVKYGKELANSDWGRRLLAHSFNEIMHHKPETVLLRTVRGEIRGWLSNSYRRLDAGPIVEAFASAMASVGGLAVDGVVGGLRLSLRGIVPQIMWICGDPVVIGAALQTSDYGRGTLELQLYDLRLVCINGMIGQNVLRAVHLGRRIEQENDTFSQRTHDLDTQTMASAVGDLIVGQLDSGALAARGARLERAASADVDPKTAFAELRKVMTKAEVDAASEVFAFGGDDVVPTGRSAWRLSNAVSWVARAAEPERRLDLERVAGELLEAPAAKAAVLGALIQQ